MIALLAAIAGTLAGFYARWVYDTLKDLQARLMDTKEFEKAGIVRPRGTLVPQVDLTSPSGGVRRPSPDEYLMANQKERDAKLK